jgi:hypothetical protein
LGVARTACQILNDATLSGYYPFDTTATYNDYSVNYFNGIAVGVTTLSRGRLNQAIYFPSNTSYFQAPCFASGRMSPFAFTFSLWVNPASVTGGGSLVHISSAQTGNGTTCYDLLAFTSNGALVAQWSQGSGVVNATQGPIIPANTWTHIAVMYGNTNGLRLFVNGQLSASSLNTGSTSYTSFDNQQYVTLGINNPWALTTTTTCQNGTIPIRARNGPQKSGPARFKAARMFSRPARSDLNLAQPGPEDIFYYRDFFPIEFENHFRNHQRCWEQITSVIKNMIRLDYRNYNEIQTR